MDETARSATGRHRRAAVQLAPRPSQPRGPAVPHAPRSVSPVLPPAAQLARRWLAALAGEGDEPTAERGDVPVGQRLGDRGDPLFQVTRGFAAPAGGEQPGEPQDEHPQAPA